MDSKKILVTVCFIIGMFPSAVNGICPPKCKCEIATAKVSCSNRNILKWNHRIEKNTTIVDLRNNKFTTCPALAQYKNLQTVILSKNLLTNVNQTCFNESAILKHLDLSYNKLTTLPNMTGGAEILSLNLTGNQIFELRTIAIYGLSQLKVLILDNNLLELFSGEELLQVTDRLEVLSLRNNNIKCICSDLNARLFSSAVNLRELYVSNNTLVERNSKWLIGASNLQVLDLRAAYCSFNYSVENEDAGWEFPGHSESLVRLDLSNNDLKTFGPGAFSGCKNVKSVNLTNCSLAELQPGQLEDIKKVHHLYIDHNLISNITPTLFFGLSELKVLSMESNKLHSDTSLLNLDYTQGLETINFNNNQIRNLNLLDGGSSNNLSTLLLDNNQLFDVRNLNRFPSLKVVSFRNNSLNFIPNINKLTKLERITLAHNYISVLDFDVFWVTSSPVTIDISGNKITTVKRGFLNTWTDYQTSWNVNLMGNPLHCLCSEKWFKDETHRLEYNMSIVRLYENIRLDCLGENDEIFNISYALQKTECVFIHRNAIIVLGCLILVLICCAILAIGMTMGKRLERRQRTNTGGRGRLQLDSEKKLASDFGEKRIDHSPSFMVAEKDQHLKDAISLSNLKGSMVRLDNENFKPFFREIYV